uniref:Putative ovule protein n=1 Tax=Solanum chacoense TaxID=4108 RepID=A0A0V0H6Y2_SOLCH
MFYLSLVFNMFFLKSDSIGIHSILSGPHLMTPDMLLLMIFYLTRGHSKTTFLPSQGNNKAPYIAYTPRSPDPT